MLLRPHRWSGRNRLTVTSANGRFHSPPAGTATTFWILRSLRRGRVCVGVAIRSSPSATVDSSQSPCTFSTVAAEPEAHHLQAEGSQSGRFRPVVKPRIGNWRRPGSRRRYYKARAPVRVPGRPWIAQAPIPRHLHHQLRDLTALPLPPWFPPLAAIVLLRHQFTVPAQYRFWPRDSRHLRQRLPPHLLA